jgi:WD40 repeat protein/tetratricopeptide (TPR) repeat protein
MPTEAVTVVAPERSPEAQDTEPFVGPRPFEQRDTFRFFGRDREAGELVSLVLSHPAVLLYAQSGAGKTSLINAQLIPRLHDQEKCQVLKARVQGPAQNVDLEKLPNVYVFHTLMSWAGNEADPAALARFTLSDYIQQRKREHQADLADSWDEDDMPAPWVAIFDQFEELFTYYPRYWRHRKVWFEQVREAMRDPQLRVLFAMREDHIASLDPYASLVPEKLRTRYRLERLRENAALAAVTSPVRNTGREFGDGVAEALVHNLMRVERVGPEGPQEVIEEYVEPVQLQVVCQSLWQSLRSDETEITLEHAQRCGDVSRALLEYYEQGVKRVVTEAGVEEQVLRQWFEDHLITPTGTRGMVFADADQAEGMPRRVVELLENLYLLRREPRGMDSWFELTHDRLVGPIQKSNRSWFQKRDIRLLTEKERKEAERQAERKIRRLLLTGLAIAVVLAVAALIGLLFARSLANQLDDSLAREKADRAVLEGIVLFEKDDPFGSLVWFTHAMEEEKDPARKAIHEMRLGASLGQLPPLVHLFTHKKLDLATFSSDGRRILVVGDEKAHVWEMQKKTGSDLEPFHVDKHKVTHAVLNKNGKILVTVGEMDLEHGMVGGAAWVWEVESRRQLRPLTHDGPVSQAYFSPVNNNLVLTVSQNITTRLPLGGLQKDKDSQWKVRLWDIQTGNLVAELAHQRGEEVTSAAFSLDGSRVVTVTRSLEGSEGKTSVWDISDFGQREEPHRPVATGPKIGPSDANAAANPSPPILSADSALTDSPKSNPSRLLRTMKYDGPVTSADFSPPHGSYVVTIGSVVKSGRPPGSHQAAAQVWSVATGRWTELPRHGHVSFAAFSPDGSLVVTADDETAQVWRWSGRLDNLGRANNEGEVDYRQLEYPGTPILTLRHGSSVRSVAFSPDGHHLATAGRDKFVRVWELATGRSVLAPLSHNATVGQLSFHPDGSHLLAIGPKIAQVWAVPTGLDAAPLLRATRGAAADPARMPRPGTTAAASDWVNHVAWSPDGRWVVASCGLPGTAKGEALLWDAKALKGQPKRILEHKGDGAFRFAAFSADGRRLVTASELRNGTEGVARIWDVETGNHIDETYHSSDGPMTLATFAPGNQLVTIVRLHGTAPRGKAQVWKRGESKPLREFRHKDLREDDPEGNVLTFAAMSEQGNHLVTTSVDDTASVWDLRAGEEVDPLKLKHTADVMHAAFDQDGKLVATASLDQTVRIWSVTDGTLLKTLELGGAALSVAFGSDGRLVTASKDGSARIYHISFSPGPASGNPLLTLDLVAILKHQGEVRDAFFNEAGNRLLTISYPDLPTRSLTGPSLYRPSSYPLVEEDIGTSRSFAGLSAYRWFSPRQWPVAPAKGSQADLRTFCELISSRAYDESLFGLRLLEDGTDLEARWERFRQEPNRRPVEWDTVSSDPAELWAKLEGHAKEHEDARDWFAASWYLTKMIEQKNELLIEQKKEAELHWRRGKAYANLPGWRYQVLIDYNRAIELDPEDWRPMYSRARFYAQAPADWDKALADYDKVLDRKKDDFEIYQWRAVACEGLKLWDRAIDDYSEALKLKGAERNLLARRGRANAEAQKWKEAAADLAQATGLDPSNYNLWYQMAVAQLAQNDKEAYRKTCHDMLHRFGRTTNSLTANQVAWTGVLNLESGITASELVRLAKQAVANSRGHSALKTLGAAYYRSGEYPSAITQLDDALQEVRKVFLPQKNRLDIDAELGPLPELGVYNLASNWLLLAMAYQKNGNPDHARKSLERAILLLDQDTPGKKKDHISSQLYWNHRVELNLLRREAEELLGPKSP